MYHNLFIPGMTQFWLLLKLEVNGTKRGKSENGTFCPYYILKSKPIINGFRLLFFNHFGLVIKAALDIGSTWARTPWIWSNLSKMNGIFGDFFDIPISKGNNNEGLSMGIVIWNGPMYKNICKLSPFIVSSQSY